MITLNDYLKKEYGRKIYKISLNAGMTCPNRDGTIDTRGCAFCSAGGSGDFTFTDCNSISEQIEKAKKLVANKISKDDGNPQYIAYFQTYTNTYAPVDKLRKLFYEVINRDDIAILSIATRPDCLGDDVMQLLSELNRIKPVWVELGLQTIHKETAKLIRRGYKLNVFDDAVKRLHANGIKTIVHLILFLPGESQEDMTDSLKYVLDKKVFGVKLQLLQVLKGTDVANWYEEKPFYLPNLDEYAEFIGELTDIIGDRCVIHRLTGDGPKSLLIAPKWCADKKRVVNAINQKCRQ